MTLEVQGIPEIEVFTIFFLAAHVMRVVGVTHPPALGLAQGGAGKRMVE